jgi:hypothetical protein
MEPNAIYATRQGNLDGERIEMSVDAASMAHVMSILTDLYSDPVMAVIREYSTNARDAMIEAGNGDKPIEVSLPNAMSPFFKVRDYGVGLSVEDIRNIYSKYGASTKRSTNEQVGMLGLGCKSALTYTQQFTVRSVKDGEVALVAISRTENGSGVMEVVHVSPIDEPNGVEISVPVGRSNDFTWKAEEFFRYWEPGTVLVNGVEPKSFVSDCVEISDGLYIKHGTQNDFVVMGNVAYRVNSENPLYKPSVGSYGYYSRNFGVIAVVPIGSVNFTPSREDLHYTKHTLDTLKEVRENVEKYLLASIQKEVDEQETPRDARIVADRWNHLIRSSSKFSYKGKTIPNHVDVGHLRYHYNYGRGSVDFYNTINYAQAEQCIFVDGYEKSEISTAHRLKFRLWAAENNHRGNITFVVTDGKIDETWFNPVASTSWEEVFKCRPPKDTVGGKSVASFNVRTNESYNYDRSVHELPKKKYTVLWTSGDKEISEVIGKVAQLSKDAVFVNLPKNRWDKFVRENKSAMTLTTYIGIMVDNSVANLSKSDALYITMHYDERAVLTCLDSSKVDDPELAEKIDAAKIRPTDAASRYVEVYNLCRRANFTANSLDKGMNILEVYPLLRSATSVELTAQHCYTYVNAVYNSDK